MCHCPLQMLSGFTSGYVTGAVSFALHFFHSESLLASHRTFGIPTWMAYLMVATNHAPHMLICYEMTKLRWSLADFLRTMAASIIVR